MDGFSDDEEEFNDLETARIREELMRSTTDYGAGISDYAASGDSDLERGFRSLEEIEEDAERERLAWLDQFDGDFQFGDEAIAEEFIPYSEDTFAPSLEAGGHRSLEALESVRHILFS